MLLKLNNELSLTVQLIAALFLLTCFFPFIANSRTRRVVNKTLSAAFSDSVTQQKLVIITDQSLNRIIIVDPETKEITWEWRAVDGDVRMQDRNWFDAPSDAKPVLNGKYILMTASKGGVALIRISDKKTVFYAYAGGNTHSAAILPDGNIVSASSTDNYLMVFRTDTLHFPDFVYTKKIFLPFAHNVVWDHKRQVLWSAAKNKLYTFRYNSNCRRPDLKVIDSTIIADTDAHDLFPVYDNDLLWLTTLGYVFKVNPVTKNIETLKGAVTKNIKNVSSGPAGYPTIMMLPKEKWWTDEVTDENGKSIFKQAGLKIYKARWLLPDLFAGDKNSRFTICKDNNN